VLSWSAARVSVGLWLRHWQERCGMPFNRFLPRRNVFPTIFLFRFKSNYDGVTVLKQSANRAVILAHTFCYAPHAGFPHFCNQRTIRDFFSVAGLIVTTRRSLLTPSSFNMYTCSRLINYTQTAWVPLSLGSSIYDVQTEGEGGQAQVYACGRGRGQAPCGRSRRKLK